MKFKICVAIPIKTTDLQKNKALFKKVLEEKPEFVEFRFDYIDDLQKITPNFIKDLLDIVQQQAQYIFTFRDSSEGGQIELGQSERLKIIKLLVEAQPQYIDIEMNTDREILQEIINIANENEVKLIFSYHDFKKTPSSEEGITLVKKFKDNLLNNHMIDFISIKEVIYKIIFTAQIFEDNLVPMKICKTLIEKEQIKHVISFCMGEMGIFSRVLCVNSGSFLTYASLEEKTAQGQINIKKMREIHELLF